MKKRTGIIFLFISLVVVLSVSLPASINAAAIVGAIRWDAWTGPSNFVGTQVEKTLSPSQYHYRLPFFAVEYSSTSVNVQCTTQSCMDQEIAYAASMCLDYWAFIWYPAATGMQQSLNLYLSSANKNDVNFSLIVEHYNYISQITNAQIITYMQMPQYQKVMGNRPLLYFFDGTDPNLSAANISALRALAAGAGLADPYIVLLRTGADLTRITTLGINAWSMYAASWIGSGAPYSDLISAETWQWNDVGVTKGYKLVPHVTGGWDKRTRHDNPVSWEADPGANAWVQMPTPLQLANYVQSAITWVAAHPASAESEAILVYAWNEFDEGGYICPNLAAYGGTQRRDALQPFLCGTTATPVFSPTVTITGTPSTPTPSPTISRTYTVSPTPAGDLIYDGDTPGARIADGTVYNGSGTMTETTGGISGNGMRLAYAGVTGWTEHRWDMTANKNIGANTYLVFNVKAISGAVSNFFVRINWASTHKNVADYLVEGGIIDTSWKTARIPLADILDAGQTVLDFINFIDNNAGDYVVMADNIMLQGNPASPTFTPTLSATDTVTRTATGTGTRTSTLTATRSATVSATATSTAVTAPLLAQECDSINYFSPHNVQGSCWGGTWGTADMSSLSDIYFGGGATFASCASADVPVNMAEGSGSLVFTSTKPAGGWWNLIFRTNNGMEVDFKRLGSNPYLHLRLRWGTIAPGADMEIGVQTVPDDFCNGLPQHEGRVTLGSYVTPSASWQDVYIPMSAFLANNPSMNLARVEMLRFYGLGTYAGTNTIYMEKLRLVESPSCNYTGAVKVNQVGYLPNMPKTAIIGYKPGAVVSAPSSFDIVTEPGGAVVYSAALSAKVVAASGPGQWDKWDLDGDEVYHADFSSFVTPGTYRVSVPQIGQVSRPFTISCNVYDSVFRDSLRFYYYARSGEAIVEPYAEGHTRPAFYTGDSASTYKSAAGTRNVSGGLFDAGDLHKDMHAQRYVMYFLLETLKDFGNKVAPNSLNIPESSATVSDLYFLIKKQLDWMIKMWNPDGSVHFYVDITSECDTVGDVSAVSSGSAAILAASFAKAYTLFKNEPALLAYANSLLSMAETSWAWLAANTANVDPGDHAYSFNANEDAAARMWAAAELFNATGTAAYNAYFTGRYSDPLNDFGGNQSWGGVIQYMDHSIVNLAYMAYANTTQPAASAMIQNDIKTEFKVLCDWILDKISKNTYKLPIVANNHMYWGSSGTIATTAYTFKQAYDWYGTQAYKDAMANSIDWILGRNTVNRNFVTGYGDALSGTDVYGFYWMDVNNPPPGYLCGNVNGQINSTLNHDGPLSPYIVDPWKAYMNLQDASILEPGIYWNAELSWLMGYVSQGCAVTPTFTPALTSTATVTVTRTATVTPSATATVTLTLTVTNTPAGTLTNTPVITASNTESVTMTTTGTPVITVSYTETGTPTITITYTVTPVNTFTRTPSAAATFTGTPSNTAISTATQSVTPALTHTATLTFTPTPTPAPSGGIAIVDALVYPCPLQNNTSPLNFLITFFGSPAKVTMDIYTVNFRKVRKEIWTTGLSYPSCSVNVPADRINGLARGMYYYVVQAEDSSGNKSNTLVKPLLILK